eukprot:gene9183-12402_t
MPRLYLATPLVDDPAALVASLPALLDQADVAAVLLRLKPTDQRTMISRIKALAPAVQNAGAALLIEGNVELVARGAADRAPSLRRVLAQGLQLPPPPPCGDRLQRGHLRLLHAPRVRLGLRHLHPPTAAPPSAIPPRTKTAAAAAGNTRRTAAHLSPQT